MNKLLSSTFSICLITISFFGLAQNEKTESVYTENVEVHLNTDFLITGETLYYSIHCLDAVTNKPSTLSKLAYVELIGENEKPFLQTKVSLMEGRGAGEFFLPSTLPSGNYTLITYTKWMRNFSLENFFQKQITIINPYVKPFPSGTQVEETNVSTHPSNKKIKNETTQVNLSSDKKKYSPRQKVVVVIKNNDASHACRVSLNVHSTSAVSKPEPLSNRNANAGTDQEAQIKKEFVTFLPDLRGETITGIVKESVSHQPVPNTTIYLSIKGTSTVFQISRTDSTGRFHFSTKKIQSQTGIQFQVDRPAGSAPVEIILDSEFINDYGKFKPSPLSIDISARKEIEQRNVYSQIENAYFTSKRDSIFDSTQGSFFGTPDKVYKLDDFTRFPTMEDIFREYILEVYVTKREGKFKLQMMNGRNGARFINTPLILVDGIRVFDTETLMNYNPLLIKTVSLITSQYVYAGILFDGILSINTYEGNATELPVSTTQKEYTSWQQFKKYYSPVYNSAADLTRIPDYRVQLFWNPSITVEPGQEFIGEFYTSDVEGEFLIEVKGYNSKGEVVSISSTIEVRK